MSNEIKYLSVEGVMGDGKIYYAETFGSDGQNSVASIPGMDNCREGVRCIDGRTHNLYELPSKESAIALVSSAFSHEILLWVQGPFVGENPDISDCGIYKCQFISPRTRKIRQAPGDAARARRIKAARASAGS